MVWSHNSELPDIDIVICDEGPQITKSNHLQNFNMQKTY